MVFLRTCFVWSFLVMIIVVLFLNNGIKASHEVFMKLQSSSAMSVRKIHRTGYHFQPPKHWINDPNGPMYYNGVYHLFYQYNPKGAVWGNIVWAHSVSTDLINWIRLEHAIYPSKVFDKYGTWSGSITILQNNKPVILYTGIVDENNTQVQNYAIPADVSDPLLRKWIKPDDNPLIVADKSINKTQFRDPTTAWLGRDGHWRMLVGSARRHRGVAILYRSRDFLKWTKAQHPLHTSVKTGNWECPDFFPVSLNHTDGLDTSVDGENVKHVLKASLEVTRFDYYTIGTYDTKKDRYIPDDTMIDGWKGLRLDYGNFYASKTFYDPSKNRRILWGWANESDAAPKDSAKKGWAGIQAIPRKLWLDPSGKQLVQWPVEELESLRKKKVELRNHNLDKGEMVEVEGITAAQADVEVTFSFSSLKNAEEFDPSWADLYAQDVCAIRGSTVQGGLGPFGLLTLSSENLEEYTPVFFRVFKVQDKYKVLMCSDASRSTLRNNSKMYKPSFAGFVDVDLSDKKLSLRSLIDHSVIESFGAGGKTCITSRVYPALAIYNEAHLFVFNNGTETITIDTLNAWSMDKSER
ncbi:beta-fructofuranosidase, insoluble isoenzyme 1-like isoform X1 [Solanum dulcamara]|uniref:beta-fructofuranosidase, insoluble isoenzyme 1-like isoform X1 n=1 Tax=Solanum dulcamara TaxID=45834 RepID=UPI0024856248|nr:beta-fructofuranosidase, insoluble isoenzyme 1-like isoform X1 [Solanum dulcamara]